MKKVVHRLMEGFTNHAICGARYVPTEEISFDWNKINCPACINARSNYDDSDNSQTLYRRRLQRNLDI